ncbi:MAG: DUF2252 family protein [Myxococcales bacterium]|nr:DUF2252 domain-containing protein [Polyangiaceae bacterium]MDW8247813.1 DUF2252 family protein [Myxococcales bacterium]
MNAVQRLLGAILAVTVLSCEGNAPADPRASQMAQFFSRALLPLARSRPHQLRLRFDEMAISPFRFLRGSEILYTRDLRDASLPFAQTSLPGVDRVLLLGDAHLENVGTYLGPRVDLNDFDVAGFGPPWWEVRRAAASLLVGLREANPGKVDEQEAAATLARAYAAAVVAGEVGEIRPGEVGVVIQKRLDSAAKDGTAREELDEFTRVSNGQRWLKRGITDPSDPREALLAAPPAVVEALPQALSAYLPSLFRHDFPPGYFAIKDVARRCGQGVGSLTAVRFYVLIEGASPSVQDDVILQLKESPDASLDVDLAYGPPPSSQSQRVVERQRRLQSVPDADPHLGYTRLLDIPVVVSTITDFQKTVRVGDLEGRSAADLLRFASDFGHLLGRSHARGVTVNGELAREPLRAWLAGREDAFAAETAAAAVAYADQVVADHQRFLALRRDFGPLLGLQDRPPNDTPSDLAARAVLDPPCP